jgi:sulfate transport system substrate-binding protein
MSHGGSGKQARSVIDGLDADVVTLALEADIDAIAQNTTKLPKDWRSRLPDNSSPYTSTIVFLVRKGNPKAINDWGDLVKDGVEVITPNPKTSGGARWNYLAAWAWAEKAFGGDEAKVKAYMGDLFRHVPVLDTGARGSTTTFAQRGIGDVLLAWENEAFLSLAELGAENFDIVIPSLSIKAEPPVALVDGNVDVKGTRKVAEAYLEYLYSDVGQNLAAKHYYRPSKPSAVDPEYLKQFPEVALVTIDDYGFLLTLRDFQDLPLEQWRELFHPDNAEPNLRAALDESDLVRWQFRGVAQTALMVPRNHPGKERRLKQLRFSADILFNVLRDHEPDHPVLVQSIREATHTFLDTDRALSFLREVVATTGPDQPGIHPTPDLVVGTPR